MPVMSAASPYGRRPSSRGRVQFRSAFLHQPPATASAAGLRLVDGTCGKYFAGV
jgi:hypothetical protein